MAKNVMLYVQIFLFAANVLIFQHTSHEPLMFMLSPLERAYKRAKHCFVLYTAMFIYCSLNRECDRGGIKMVLETTLQLRHTCFSIESGNLVCRTLGMYLCNFH
jgi:predicted ABC-type exoprotein transport system permease subunit